MVPQNKDLHASFSQLYHQFFTNLMAFLRASISCCNKSASSCICCRSVFSLRANSAVLDNMPALLIYNIKHVYYIYITCINYVYIKCILHVHYYYMYITSIFITCISHVYCMMHITRLLHEYYKYITL